jgi:K+-transporting ATPase KdpF subunit
MNAAFLVIGLVLSILLFGYLAFVMLRPERF